MPIIDMKVPGGRCDRCQRQEPIGPDRAETEAILRDCGWQELSAGLWLCADCVQRVSDPADFAAAVLVGRRSLRQGN
jgi:hypothetical protein